MSGARVIVGEDEGGVIGSAEQYRRPGQPDPGTGEAAGRHDEL